MSGRAIYYSAVWGALGGLLGYIVSLIVGLVVGDIATTNDYVTSAIAGASVGGGIALFISFNFASHNAPIGTALGTALQGLILGIIIGSLTNVLGNFILITILGYPILVLTGVWALFGLLSGYVVSRSSGVLPRNLMFGGVLGGALGGLLLSNVLTIGLDNATTVTIIAALGVTVMGATIGSFMRIAEQLLSSAYVERLLPDYGSKKKVAAFMMEASKFTLDKALISGQNAVIGSDRKQASSLGRDIYIQDPTVEARHALLCPVEKKYFEIVDESGGKTQVNNQRVFGSRRLNHGDTITVGTVQLQYIERRADGSSVDNHAVVNKIVGKNTTGNIKIKRK